MNSNIDLFEVPILFIVFTRLDTTQRVFERIREIKPKKLYIAADGPRDDKKGEGEKVNTVRTYIVSNIDWECEVITKFSDANLGCKYSPQNAISWFFEHEEAGIILEDDCLPSINFFRYCEELLNRYRDDLRIWGISGSNLLPDVKIEKSYFFSEFFLTWGWATWRDRWQEHNRMLENFEDYLNDPLITKKTKNNAANSQLVDFARISHEDLLDAWDYPWMFSCLANNALLATPAINLIQNIGFGEDATHTTDTVHKQVPEQTLSFPLEHPIIFHVNQTYDKIFYIRIYGWQSKFKKFTSFNYVKKAIKVRINKYLLDK